jgi:hypothetical protein
MRATQLTLALSLIALAIAGCGDSGVPPLVTTATSQPTANAAAAATTTQPAVSPAPTTTPAFSLNGHTYHGDTIHLSGRWGPILPPSESDVDPTALSQCPDVDGRELIRKLTITATITSGLSADVTIEGFPVVPYEEPPHTHGLLDFVIDEPGGASCHRNTTEAAASVNLGTLQPHTPAELSVWVVLPDAITPRDPHPSAKTLAHETWLLGSPSVIVDGEAAISGEPYLSVTK